MVGFFQPKKLYKSVDSKDPFEDSDLSTLFGFSNLASNVEGNSYQIHLQKSEWCRVPERFYDLSGYTPGFALWSAQTCWQKQYLTKWFFLSDVARNNTKGSKIRWLAWGFLKHSWSLSLKHVFA